MNATQQRILRQFLMTDRLLGIDAVPIARPPAAREGADAESGPGTPSAGAAPASLERSVDADAKRQILTGMEQDEVRNCTRCVLCEGRRQTVFGEGKPNAQVMFIGEGPGQREDEQGRPFVGPAGEMLDKWIGAMGCARADVYIANVVKCRPPHNRAPLPDEVEACAGYLRRQIETIRPRVLVALGGPAAKFLLQSDQGITRLRGTWGMCHHVDPPIPVMPTYHPAYLLRRYTQDNRAKVWADLQQVRDKIAGH